MSTPQDVQPDNAAGDPHPPNGLSPAMAHSGSEISAGAEELGKFRGSTRAAGMFLIALKDTAFAVRAPLLTSLTLFLLTALPDQATELARVAIQHGGQLSFWLLSLVIACYALVVSPDVV